MSKDAVEQLRQAARNERTVLSFSELCGEQRRTIESLRAQLAEERQQKHEALHREYCRREELNQQLLATQAYAARLVAAFKVLQEAEHAFSKARGGPWVQRAVPLRNHYDLQQAWGRMHTLTSTPVSLDALDEALALECERLATICKAKSDELYNRNPRMQHHTGAGTGCDLCADICKKEAAAHRDRISAPASVSQANAKEGR